MSDDLVKWLRAQIADEARIVELAIATTLNDLRRDNCPASRDELFAYDPEFAWRLRGVEAKQRILERYEDARARIEDPDAVRLAREYEDFVLPALALAYADRPGYVAEWAPA